MPRLSKHDWPARLWIVRHGESAGNVARAEAEDRGHPRIDVATRDADTPLSPLGHAQSRALAAWFAAAAPAERPNVLFSSPFERSRQTAGYVAEALALAAPCVDERLREREFGIFDRYTRHGILQTFPELAAQRALVGKFYFRPPGGESWCDVILRLRSVLELLRHDHVGDRVLVVAHQVIANCFRYLLDALDEATVLALDRGADVPNCGITEYALDATGGETGFRLVRANHVLPLLAHGTPVTTSPDVPQGPR